jgi:hypothetical protein
MMYKYILFYSICVSLEIYGIPYMKKVTEFREIPRNFTELYDTEFSGIPRNFSQFRTKYGMDGSKKNRRNSVSTEFRGHPTLGELTFHNLENRRKSIECHTKNTSLEDFYF